MHGFRIWGLSGHCQLEPKIVFWTILVLQESTEVLRGQLYSFKEDNTDNLNPSVNPQQETVQGWATNLKDLLSFNSGWRLGCT